MALASAFSFSYVYPNIQVDAKMLLVRRIQSVIHWQTARKARLRPTRTCVILEQQVPYHGQNLSSASGESKPVAQYFFEDWTTGRIYDTKGWVDKSAAWPGLISMINIVAV